MKDEEGHILVGLDGTLAHHDAWKGPEHIGEPIKPMLDRVKKWIEEGKDVRIFTARVFPHEISANPISIEAFNNSVNDVVRTGYYIQRWCEKHIGQILPITCRKDFATVEIWDDRAIGVILNRGISQEMIVALALHRVLTSAGLQVKDGTGYQEAADLAVHRIAQIRKRFDDVFALVDGASDALSYVAGPATGETDLSRAKAALAKAVALLKQEI